MSLNNQNNLQITSTYKALTDQNDLQIDLVVKRVLILSPTDGQTDFPQGGLYEWAFSGDEQVFRVEVATDAGFTSIVQEADVEAKELTSTVSAATGYNIRISALQLVNPSDSEITGVSLNTTVTEVQEGNNLVIIGSVEGEGDYNTSGTWTRESGNAIPFTVSGNEITITGDTETNSATFRFTSDQDNSFFEDRTVTVTAAPAVGINNSRAGDEESLRLHAEALGVANWYQNFGWSASSMSLDDNIHGVTTELINGELRVTEIDLMTNNLVGELPEFPGLQECWKMRFKQREANEAAEFLRITGRIPDSIGNNTKVTHLSLSGRRDSAGDPLDIFQYEDGDYGSGYNMKFGVAANQFDGGIPNSLYNLTLRRLEIDGQFSQFGATLKEDCSNWDITHIYATGNGHYTSHPNYVQGESAFFGAMPSGTKSWINCVRFQFTENKSITSYELDMFEGWLNLVRVIGLGGIMTQPIPNMEGLTKILELFIGSITPTGSYPLYFHEPEFTNIRTLTFPGHGFSDNRNLDFQNSNINQTFSIGLSTADDAINGLTGRLFTGSVGARGMILFDTRQNQSLKDIITEGVHQWPRLRYYRAQGTGGSTLPSKPPGMYSASLRGLTFQGSKMKGQLTSDWKFAGSLDDRGGIVTSGTYTSEGGQDATGYYVDDSNANFGDLTGLILNNADSNSGNKRREILSNTSTRIYYEVFENGNGDTVTLNTVIGGNYQIERNTNTDNRGFDENILLQTNFLKDTVPVDVAPLYLVGGNFDLSKNLFQMKDIAPAVANIEKRSRMNWMITNPRTLAVNNEELEGATSSGNVTFSYNGNSIVIALSATDSGDVQAQQIADEITADTGIELTCEYSFDGKTLVFDSLLSGIDNALKDITFTDTGGTGFSFATQGYNFVYAPQGRLDERESPPEGYTVPQFFQNETRIVTIGTDPVIIDFSDQAYAGNVYTWKKKAVGASEYVALSDGGDISGATTDTLSIATFEDSDRGDYILEITNPAAPDFTGEDVMRSGIITLKI